MNVRPCLDLKDFKCLGEIYDHFNLQECQLNSCPLECESMSYDLSISSLEFPDKITYDKMFNIDYYRKFYESLNLTMTYELLKSNVAFFNVYYPNLHYNQISESPKTDMFDLFTQIGGALGMFVSFSIFTLFEFIEIVVLLLANFISKNENKNKKLNTAFLVISRRVRPASEPLSAPYVVPGVGTGKIFT